MTSWRDMLNGFLTALAMLPLLSGLHLASAISPILSLALAVGIGAASSRLKPECGVAVLVAVIGYTMFLQALLLPAIDPALIFVFPPLLTLAVMGGLAGGYLVAYRRSALELAQQTERRWLVMLGLVMLGIGAYGVVGMARADIVGVGYYARMLVWPLAVAGVCVLVLRGNSIERLATVVAGALMPVLAIYALEAWLGTEWYRLVNAVRFEELKYGSATEMADILNSLHRPALNLGGQFSRLGIEFGADLPSLRYMGPDMHHVSSGYLLLGLTVALLVSRLWPLALVPIALLLITGVKGPLIILGLIAIACVAVRFGFLFVATGSAAVVGGLLMIAIGIASCDPHVRGLLGGVAGFAEYPHGQGFGIGGNHGERPVWQADGDVPRGEWDAPFGGCHWHKHGYESAFGALIYQVGVLAMLVLALAIHGLRRFAARAQESGVPTRRATAVLVASGVGLLLTSFFQEEALSPTAMTVPLILLVSAAVSTGHSRQEGRRDKAGSEAAGDL